MNHTTISSSQAMIDLGTQLAADSHHKILVHGEFGASKTYFAKYYSTADKIKQQIIDAGWGVKEGYEVLKG